MTKSMQWLAVMALAVVACTKRDPYRCNLAEPCVLTEAPYCDVAGEFGSPYTCIPTPGLVPDGGVDGAPRDPLPLRVSPERFEIGQVHEFAYPYKFDFEIVSMGTGNIGPLSLSVVGADSDVFRIRMTDCEQLLIAPGQKCSASMELLSTKGGMLTAILRISGGAGHSPLDVPLSGNVSPLVFEPASIDMGAVAVSDVRVVHLRLKNRSASDVQLPGRLAVGPSGPMPAATFSISRDTCLSSLVVGSVCDVDVTVRPMIPNTWMDAQLVFQLAPSGPSFGGGSIRGWSQGPFVFGDPGLMSFGTVAVGQELVRTIPLVNAGQGDSAVLAVSGPDASEFSVVATQCNQLFSGRCDFRLAFRPLSAGAKSATITATGVVSGTVAHALTGDAQ